VKYVAFKILKIKGVPNIGDIENNTFINLVNKKLVNRLTDVAGICYDRC